MRKLFKLSVSKTVLGLLCLVVAVLISACASSGTPATGATPSATPAATSTAAPQTPPSATPGADGSPPINTPAAALVPMEQRKTGDLEDITFVIGEGSEATLYRRGTNYRGSTYPTTPWSGPLRSPVNYTSTARHIGDTDRSASIVQRPAA